MIAFHTASDVAAPSRHAGFLALLPTIQAYVRRAFRHLAPEARDEAVQEGIGHAFVAYARLVQRGKTELAYASPLARYAVARFRVGRRIGSPLNCHDILSPYAQRKKNFTVERLDRCGKHAHSWEEVLVEDKRCTPAEIAAGRIDFAAWLRTLSARDRKVAQVLAIGETTNAAAQRFHVTPARISQVRRELQDAWRRFQGEIS